MIYAVIVIIALIAIALVLFGVWFASLIEAGKCPLCAIKQIVPTKLTLDISNQPDYDNNTQQTPIMGWSSWNKFRNHIDEESMYEIAVAMKETGLADAGYNYVNLDDCWHSSLRDSDGKLQGDLETFPSGIPDLVQKVNDLGLKLGLYSSNGTLTCEDLPASLGNEVLDAKTLASWGVEYFKYDFCHNERIYGDCPAIEYAELNLPGERASIRLSPQDAVFEGKAKIVNIKRLPTQTAFGFINHGAGSATFNFNADVEGEYVMTIHFHKGNVRHRQYVQVTVNGKMQEVFFPATKCFTPDARQQVMVYLQQGENTIRFANPIVTLADSSYTQYMRMANALKDATSAWAQFTETEEKPIVFSLCEWGTSLPWKWGAKTGNMWRTTHDIFASWLSIVAIYSRTVDLYQYASAGHFNDPDMLEVGNGKLTEEENKSHFTLWCMMAAPLVLGNDLRELTDKSDEKAQMILNILTNKSLILIDQDPLAKPAKRIKKSIEIDIIARPLNNGDVAVCFLNKSSRAKTFSFDIEALCSDEYLNFDKDATGYQVHDLWSDERFTASKLNGFIPKHGVKVFRISK